MIKNVLDPQASLSSSPDVSGSLEAERSPASSPGTHDPALAGGSAVASQVHLSHQPSLPSI